MDAVKVNPPKVGRQLSVDHRKVTERLFPKKTIKADDPNSLEGKVDLARVRDARRALRRKYAVRNNVDAIFSKYDGGKKGYIDMYDLIRQTKHIGLGVSEDEALVLIKSAKLEDGSAELQLNMDEYANLLFNQDDRLGVSTKDLRPASMLPKPDSKASITSFGGRTEESLDPEPKGLHDDNYIVLDKKKVPTNALDSIEKKLVRTNRRICGKFSGADNFNEELKK